MLLPNLRVRRSVPAAVVAASLVLCLGYLYLSPQELREHASSLPSWATDRLSPSHVYPDVPTPPDEPAQPSKPDKPTPPDATASEPAVAVADLPELPIPFEYILDSPSTPFCDNRFNAKYVVDLRASGFQYCNTSSRSSLTCFHSKTTTDNRADSMCIAEGVVFDPAQNKFVLNCNVVQPDLEATQRGAIPFGDIREYWYDTGPKRIFDHNVEFVGGDAVAPLPEEPSKEVRRHHFTLMIKREGDVNPWHCLLEIWSMAMSMDVLRSVRDPADPKGRPHFLGAEDSANVQVVILDERGDGPYFDLWRLFSSRKPLRLKELATSPQAMAFYNTTPLVETRHHMVVPLAGGSNPLWQNDWTARECTRSDTLRVFVKRVLDHYSVDDAPVEDNLELANPPPIRVTFIDRKDADTRRLADQDKLLDAIRTKYDKKVVVEAVDFGSQPFAEQLKIAHATDVLVGVHGAGLTHTMFLREHTSAVVEIQPSDMENTFMGFRNLANMRGINYYRATAAPVNETETPAEKPAEKPAGSPTEPSEKKEEEAGGDKQARSLERRASWHRENFVIDSDVFMRVVGAAIESVYNKGIHHFDMV